MKRTTALLVVLTLGFWLMPDLISTVKADDNKDTKKSDKDKDEKSEPVKTSQTTKAGTVAGKITGRDENSFTLEVGKDRNKKTVDILIAQDAKIRLPAEQEFDEKGKPKPFKKDPSDPDRNLLGVRGTKADLHDGQNVIVTLGRLPNKKLVATRIYVVADKK